MIGSLHRQTVDVHGELPEVAADPGSVQTTGNTQHVNVSLTDGVKGTVHPEIKSQLVKRLFLCY